MPSTTTTNNCDHQFEGDEQGDQPGGSCSDDNGDHDNGDHNNGDDKQQQGQSGGQGDHNGND